MIVHNHKFGLRGMLFRLPCHGELLILCVKGMPPAHKLELMGKYTWQGIACPKCTNTYTAELSVEPKWTHTDLPDPYAELDHCLYQITMEGLTRWIDAGRPRWVM